MIKRRSFLRALFIGTALAFPVAKLRLKDDPVYLTAVITWDEAEAAGNLFANEAVFQRICRSMEEDFAKFIAKSYSDAH